MMPLPSSLVLWAASDLEREIDEAFDRWIESPWRHGQGLTGWPAVDLYDVDGAFLLLADLPGVTPEDIELKVNEREFPLWEPAGNGPRDPRPTLPGRE